jgi:PTS system nitrogen regulatory IIA component
MTPSVRDTEPLSEALGRGGVAHDLPGTTRDAVIEASIARMPFGPETDRRRLLAEMLAREALGSTAVGDGVAFPHVQNPSGVYAGAPVVFVCYLRQAVDFGAFDGRPVEVIFALLAPTLRAHLRLLSRLAHMLRDPRFRAAVDARAGAEELLALARTLEVGPEAERRRAT